MIQGQFLNCQVTEKGEDVKLELADFIITRSWFWLVGAEGLLCTSLNLYPYRKGNFKKHSCYFALQSSGTKVGDVFSDQRNTLTSQTKPLCPRTAVHGAGL